MLIKYDSVNEWNIEFVHGTLVCGTIYGKLSSPQDTGFWVSLFARALLQWNDEVFCNKNIFKTDETMTPNKYTRPFKFWFNIDDIRKKNDIRVGDKVEINVNILLKLNLIAIYIIYKYYFKITQ